MNMLAVCIILCLSWLVWKMRRERQEKERQLRQMNYNLEVEQALFSAHMRPEQFNQALQRAADYLGADTVFFCSVFEYLDKGQLFWVNQHEDWIQKAQLRQEADQKKAAAVECLPAFLSLIRGKEEWTCFELAALQDEMPEYRTLEKHFIENLMLLPIRNEYGSLQGLLGAWNFRRQFQDAQPLRMVSDTFAEALEHYTTFQNLAYLGQTDGLTGLKNRNRYYADLSSFACGEFHSLCCIYIDANGLHELNNRLGHDAGDDMLKCIAEAFCRHFSESGIYRIGGDEFVVLCRDMPLEDITLFLESARKDILEKEYEISVGVEYQDKDYDVQEMVKNAEEAMRENKRLYYENSGRARQMRILECKADQMTVKHKDVEVFLDTMSFKFKGIFFVNLQEDTVRSLLVLPDFLQLLEETGQKFSQAMRLYNERYVLPEDYPALEHFSDFDHLNARINMEITLESYYRSRDGDWLRLRVLKLDPVSAAGSRNETIWIVEDITSNGSQNKDSDKDSEIRFDYQNESY